MREIELIINDIKKIENGNMYINEKKYYLKMIELLAKKGYYKERKSITELINGTKQ